MVGARGQGNLPPEPASLLYHDSVAEGGTEMADEQSSIDATIADLESRVMAMQEALASLRKAKEILGTAGIGTGAPSGPPRVTSEIQVDQFVGMNIVPAAEAYLRHVGRPARPTAEMIEGLGKGGLRASPDSVTTLLTRSHNGDGPIVRAQKGYWGLAEWYSRRPPRIGRTAYLKDVVDHPDTGDAEAGEAEDGGR